MNEESRTDELDDSDLAALLAAAGARSRASPEAMASVRAAVESEWRATVAARQRRRQFTGWAAAAGVAMAAVAVWIARPAYPPTDAVVASVTRVVGEGSSRTRATGAGARSRLPARSRPEPICAQVKAAGSPCA